MCPPGASAEEANDPLVRLYGAFAGTVAYLLLRRIVDQPLRFAGLTFPQVWHLCNQHLEGGGT
jgi:hypothetical protein